MSKHLFVFTAVLFCGFLNSCTSQNTGFEKIEYASFKIIKSESGQKDSMFIELYSIIDMKGLAKILNDDDYHDTLKFYTHQLDKERMAKINVVFNPQKKLNTYFITKKLADNELYGGVYHAFLVTYRNGEKDSLCFIEPFMSREFNAVYKMLDDEVFYGEDTKPCNSFRIPENFRKSVLLNYKKSTYLPNVSTLPSFRIEDQ